LLFLSGFLVDPPFMTSLPASLVLRYGVCKTLCVTLGLYLCSGSVNEGDCRQQRKSRQPTNKGAKLTKLQRGARSARRHSPKDTHSTEGSRGTRQQRALHSNKQGKSFEFPHHKRSKRDSNREIKGQ
jgi:hypothetical protein